MIVKYHVKNESFSDELIIRTLLSHAGFRFTRAESIEQANFLYGVPAAKQGVVSISENGGEPITGDLAGELNNNTLPYDIINSAKLFLTDSVNIKSAKNNFDIHSRLKFENSFQKKAGIETTPVVNRYIIFLREWVELHLGIKPEPLLPPGKKCIIALSHDVDRPVANQFLREFRFRKGWNLKQKTYHLLRYFNSRKNVKSYSSDYNNHIMKLIELESKYSFKSTFFFCASNMYSGYGSIYDVPYNINWGEVKNSIKQVKESGFETGLHASYCSYESPERIREEKEILQDISGCEVKGVRHHYWHMGENPFRTLEYHSRAGLLYDSSFAFNEHIGFRLSFASCFYPLKTTGNSYINLIEIPAMCMDGNFFYNENTSPGDAENEIIRYIESLKSVDGVGVIDWHTDAAVGGNKKYSKAADTYKNILDILGNDNEIWVRNLEETYNHFKPVTDNIIKEIPA